MKTVLPFTKPREKSDEYELERQIADFLYLFEKVLQISNREETLVQ